MIVRKVFDHSWYCFKSEHLLNHTDRFGWLIMNANSTFCLSILQLTQPIRLWQDFDVMKAEEKNWPALLRSRSGLHLDRHTPFRPRFYSAGTGLGLTTSVSNDNPQTSMPLNKDSSYVAISPTSSNSCGRQDDCISTNPPHSSPQHIEAWLASCERLDKQQSSKTYFCSNCEQMFCLESSLYEHLQSCCPS